jgi:hypothetical protein
MIESASVSPPDIGAFVGQAVIQCHHAVNERMLQGFGQAAQCLTDLDVILLKRLPSPCKQFTK